jgi:hypothetical protein
MRVLRFGICALLVFAVGAHGAVESWARAAIEVGAGLLFLLWAVQFSAGGEDSRELSISPLLPPLLAFALVVLAQIIFHFTAVGYATRQEFQLLLAYLLIFFLVMQAFRTTEDWRTLVWFLMGFGFVVALFGILQHLTFNGKLYWFRPMRYGGIPFGPYVNRNHFAAFVELVLPVSLVPLVLGKVRRERWFAVGILALVPLCALLFSASRGGIISLGAEMGVLLLMLMLRRTGGKHV